MKLRPAKVDYSLSKLPQNRIDVFFDVIKLQWKKLFICFLLIFLFSLPLHIAAIIQDIYISELSAKLSGGEITLEMQQSMYASFSNTKALIEIVFFMIFSIGFAGVSRIIRQLAYEENVSLKSDFSKGVSQNISQFLLLGFIVGFFRYVVMYYYGFTESGSALRFGGMAFTAIFIMLFVPILAYTSTAIPVYSNKFLQNIRLSATVFFKSSLKTLVTLICCFIPFAVQMIPNFLCHIIGRIVSTFISPIIMLLWYLFAFSKFDEYINVFNFPELVDKGVLGKLYKEEEEITNEEN